MRDDGFHRVPVSGAIVQKDGNGPQYVNDMNGLLLKQIAFSRKDDIMLCAERGNDLSTVVSQCTATEYIRAGYEELKKKLMRLSDREKFGLRMATRMPSFLSGLISCFLTKG